jgi:chromosome segregation ATPase
MAKSSETREKELDGGKNVPNLTAAWDNATSKVRKDIDPAANTSVVTAAKHYDMTLISFVNGIDNKGTSTAGFETLWHDLSGMDKQIEDVTTAIGKLHAESFETIKSIDAKSADDHIANWEELLKRAQNTTKEFKGYCDQLIKLNEQYDKQIAETIGKVRKQLDYIKSEMNKANSELNTHEAQFRSAVIAAENVAIKQGKAEVAKAVKSVLKTFA